MADQVSGIAGGVTGTGLGGLTGALQGGVANLLNAGQGYLDRWFPPAKREELKSKIAKFAAEKPHLAAFLLSQIALSGGPLALFFVMSLTVLIFALLAGIIVGVVGALLFTVFCVGVALLILLPTLFMTTFAACFIFLWGLGAYYIVKWFNQKEIPGIHTDAVSGAKSQLGLDGIPALNGEVPGPLGETSKSPPLKEKDTSANGQATHGEDKENKSPHSKTPSHPKRSQTPTGKGTGADVPGVGDVKKKVGGVTSSLGL
jgi:hypothetical protein